MESDMVTNNDYPSNEGLQKYILLYFEQNLTQFSFISSYDNGRYFGMKFSKQNVAIVIRKEIGFWIEISINNTEYQLWQYDRSVNSATQPTLKNILYQLDVLKRFLNDLV